MTDAVTHTGTDTRTDTRTDTVAAFLAEAADIDALVAGLDETGWRRDTPAAGWTIAHQIAHLAWTDETAVVAATDPTRFAEYLAAAGADPFGYVDRTAAEGAHAAPGDLLERWRCSRERLGGILAQADSRSRMPWFGPPMSPRSMATARLMETWAHGQDIADALGVRRTPTDRLRDIAHLGVRTRDYAYAVHGLPAPTAEFRIVLTSPSGQLWTWGPKEGPEGGPDGRHDGNPDAVTGSAEDFCLVVTQRRTPEETGLVATGAARDWLAIAQAFAGPPARTDRP